MKLSHLSELALELIGNQSKRFRNCTKYVSGVVGYFFNRIGLNLKSLSYGSISIY